MSQLKRKPSGGVRAFRGFSKVNALIARLLEGLHSAVFMGLMNDRELQDFDTYPFGDWEGASEVTDHVKHVEDWLDHFISSEISPESRALVVGAGGGRELLRLRETGCSVTGIEFDDALFAETTAMLAKSSAGDAIDMLQSDRFNLDGASNDFDVVIIPRFYASYIQGRSERVHFLNACRERLKEGGVIAFDFFTRPESEFSPGSLIFRIQPLISNCLRFIKGGKNRRIETGDHLDPQVPLLHHHYNQMGLSLELSESGLTPLEQGETWFGWVVANSSVKNSEPSKLAKSMPAATARTSSEISHRQLPASV